MGKLLSMVIGFSLSNFALKLFTTIGIGLFSYIGLLALVNKFLDLIQPMMSSLPSSILDILAIAGVPEALSVISAALLTRAAISSARAWVGTIT